MQVVSLGGIPGVILPDCEEVLEMTVEEDWTELVIASDGVWDVVPTEQMPKARVVGQSGVRRKDLFKISDLWVGVHGCIGRASTYVHACNGGVHRDAVLGSSERIVSGDVRRPLASVIA